ncbi:MAG TPA: radical SAM family heme chaperone HemW [Ohtaekwangia sp.]
MAGIYLHIPFCKQACHYCDFHFSTNLEKQNDMVDAIATELILQKGYLAEEPLKTIYLGGGTPSILSISQLEKLLNTIAENFSVKSDAEITLEANPDDLTPQKLGSLKKAGINRLSIGIQSFDNYVLKFLNRVHDSHTAISTFNQAREAGFDNISIDLIYAIPDQSDSTWRSNIQQAVDLQPEHISSYSLTIEEKTVFGRWHQKGKLTAIDDESSARQLETLMEVLGHNGYDQYEISNFSKPGFISKHNSSYWKRERYLGVGPGAHSYDGASRQYNVSDNHEYLRNLQLNKIPYTLESLSREDKINDFLLTSLRTSWGTDLSILRSEMNYDLLELHKAYIEKLLSQGFIRIENDFLILTNKGKLLADKISSDLFLITI